MDDKLKILLCEDDENLGTLLSEYLQAKGFQADLCPDGEVGYRAFLKSKYDICVLDVMMPKKDGFTLAQEIRQANAEVPIIFLTAKQLKEDILEGFKIGADDYITKPFSMEDFSTDTMTPLARKSLEFTIAALNELREKYLETKDPDLWRSIICLLPESYLQTRYCSTNYAALINVYHQRKAHRLYEWHDFCDWVADLPHMVDFLLASS